MAKKYLYKVYQGTTYKGILQNVTSEFGYDQDVNTTGAQLVIELQSPLEDTGVSLDTDSIIVSSGNYLVTHTGGRILARKVYTFDDIAIDPANRIQVWEYVDNDNGTCVFDGQLTSWNTNYRRNTLKLTVISWGSKLDDYLIQVLPGEAAASHEVNSSTLTMYGHKGTTADIGAYYQSFQLGTATQVSAIELYLKRSSGITLSPPVEIELFDWDSFVSSNWRSYATVTKNISNDEYEWVRYTFSSPISLLASHEYGIMVNFYNRGEPFGHAYQIDLAADGAAGYVSGTLYSSDDVNGVQPVAQDMNFRVITSDGSIGYTFNSYDPSDIARNLIDLQTDLGGLITYDEDSIEDTNTVVSYTFKFNTTYEGLQKCIQLAPANWYYFINPGNNVFHMHRQSGTPDHTFTLGKHIHDLDISHTMENITNVVYFSGGDTGGGEHLLRLNTNTASVNTYGPNLKLITDNRVILTDTADILSRGELTQHSKPSFRTSVTIHASVYPIHTLELGDMIAFNNSNDLIDSLLLQVVGMSRGTDKVVLRLDSLTPMQTHRIEDIKRNLDRLYTVDSQDTLT